MEDDIKGTIEAASLLMDKHHDALEAIGDAFVSLSGGHYECALKILADFKVKWDET